MIEFGTQVKEKVTGFKGTVIGYLQYATGCNQYLIVPPIDKDGKPQDGHWFDEQRVEIIKNSKRISFDNSKAKGADNTKKPSVF